MDKSIITVGWGDCCSRLTMKGTFSGTPVLFGEHLGSLNLKRTYVFTNLSDTLYLYWGSDGIGYQWMVNAKILT